MRFEPTLEEGVLLRRYKRFLADVVLADGRETTIHCANTGAMTGCAEPGSRIWYSTHDSPKRKYRHSWELVETSEGARLCVNTARANQVVGEALKSGAVDLGIEAPLRPEVAIPGTKGRFDFGNESTVIEVKSVTLADGANGYFPDAVSERARRHVEALARCYAAGLRAILLFFVPHTAIGSVAPADSVDPDYADVLREAVAMGVETVAYGCSVTPQALTVERELPVVL